jgi:hypothetical protein
VLRQEQDRAAGAGVTFAFDQGEPRGYNGGMQRWEYMTFDMTKPKRDREALNQLGREGWEAVGMVSSWGVGWRFVHPIVLLKRPFPD